MTAKLTASLREAPATVPALAALALFVVWATSQAGYPVTHWAPGGLVVLALLAMTLAIVRVRLAELPTTVRVALAALAAYTVLSFLSILWAAVPGDAWEGADRTLLYLLVFALFACWRQQGVTAALLVVAWTLALIALAAFTALHVRAADVASLQALIPGGRLVYPSGYANANAAQWLMAFWPALLLARGPRLPWALRGLLAGGAVLLAEVALLSQSRGSLYATPVMLVLVFALLPGRTRTFALLVPVALGIAAAAPAVLRVGDHLHAGQATPAAAHGAVSAMFLAAVVVGLAVALGAALETRRTYSQTTRRRVDTAVRACAVLTLVVVLVGGLAAAGNPLTRIKHGWDTFKGGYASDSSTGSRLISGLGSNRYDFYRVALDEFLAHPIAGIGADNFQEQYLVHGRSEETPRYPHSVELRTLADTGLAGVVLALVGLGAALLAGWRALRSADPLARAVAAAALAGFAYWVVHGSFDWFWEFAGLGAPAFALLGIACAVAPAPTDARERAAPPHMRGRGAPADVQERGAPADAQERGAPADMGDRPAPGLHRRPRTGTLAFAFACVLMALALAASLAAPWLSQLEVESAARIWTKAPQTAYERLHDAARLNPLSDEAYLVAGSIALRYGELARADRQFVLALGRSPDDAYATLERGAIASGKGERAAALRLLERARALDPRDGLVQQALRIVRKGRTVNVEALNRLILLKSQQLA
jgi:tetratricopeptide (TPR) repeat protein